MPKNRNINLENIIYRFVLLYIIIATSIACAPQATRTLVTPTETSGWLPPATQSPLTSQSPTPSPSAGLVIGGEKAPVTPSATPLTTEQKPEISQNGSGKVTGKPTMHPPVPSIEPDPNTRIALLLGTDRKSPEIGPTDTIILVIYNLRFERASLLSLPRDWLVYVPGHGMQRINTAYELGGIELLNHTLQYNLGIQASKWAVIHLDDFQNFVDDLGGVRVTNTLPVSDPWCQVAQGKTIQMSGYLSLCYVRSRSGNSDLARNQRQQQVFAAILKEVGRNSNLTRWPEFYQRYQDTVLTNISLQDMLEHTSLLLRLRENERVAYYHLDWEDVTPWQVPEGGASVLLIEGDHLQTILQRALRFVLSP